MNLTVIGATSRAGAHLLAQGVGRGYRITALTRRPQALTNAAALSAVVAGDGRDPSGLESAITVAEVVIAIIGAASRRGPARLELGCAS